jgi:CTP synthase (UTP-ammonia lyase)
MTDITRHMGMGVSVTVLMDLPPGQAYHDATLEALEHAATALAVDLHVRVVRTDQLSRDDYPSDSAIVVGPGSPYRDAEAVLEHIRCARERGVPLVGT